jgi:hypothetical protein
MSVNIRAKIRKLNTTQRKKLKARAAELVAEEMSLREVRSGENPPRNSSRRH